MQTSVLGPLGLRAALFYVYWFLAEPSDRAADSPSNLGPPAASQAAVARFSFSLPPSFTASEFELQNLGQLFRAYLVLYP